jgi:stearoyl-CoA desaturase (delta-9 desaturase)
VFGIWTVFFKGAWLYHVASRDKQMIAQYGVGTPDDWVEKMIYSKHSRIGILLMLILNVAVFGGWGLAIWLVQMIWIPLWAAGVINGLAHWVGYRNGETRDHSRNLVPFGIIVGGEELHSNHHLDPASPRLSLKWWEFDIGWMYLKLFCFMRLAKLTK